MESLNTLTQASWLTPLAMTLVHALWQIAVLAVLMALVFRVFRKASARTRYRIGVVAILLSIILPTVTLVNLTSNTSSQTTELIVDATERIGSPEAVFVPQQGHDSQAILSEMQGFLDENSLLIVLFWIAGALLFSLRLAGGLWKIRDLRTKDLIGPGPEISSLLEKLVANMELSQAVKLHISQNTNSPMTIGWLKPVILLPVSALSGMDPDHLEMTILHELMHIRRRDYLVNLIQNVAETIFFFHPLMWWMSSRIREERELAVDEAVVKMSGKPVSYANALLELEELKMKHSQLAMAARSGQLKSRIERIIGKQSQGGRSNLLALFSTMMICLFISGNLMLKAKQHISEDRLEETLETLAMMEEEAAFIEEEAAMLEEEIAGRIIEMNSIEPLKPEFSLASLPTMTMQVDSPITGMMMLIDGQTVRVLMDKQGRVNQIFVNGQLIPEEEEAQYMDDIMGGLKATAKANKPGAAERDAYRIKMDSLRSEMQVVQEEMQRLEREMAEENENLFEEERELRDRMRKERYRELRRRGNRWEDSWEQWGEHAEEWGERFEEDMEQWAEKFESDMEQWEGRENEEGFNDFLNESMKELGRTLGSIDELFRNDGDPEQFMPVPPSVEIPELPEMPEMPELPEINVFEQDVTRILNDELVDDDIIMPGQGYQLKVKNGNIKVNGKRLDGELEDKYARLLKKYMGEDILDSGNMSINYKQN